MTHLCCSYACSLAEIEEFQLQIASNEKVLQQTFSIAFTLSLDFVYCKVAVATLDYLSKK